MHECPWLDDCWSLPPPLGKYAPYGNSTFYLEFSRPGVLPSRVPASPRRCQKIVHMARFLPALPVIGARISRQPTRSRHPRANPRTRATHSPTHALAPSTRASASLCRKPDLQACRLQAPFIGLQRPMSEAAAARWVSALGEDLPPGIFSTIASSGACFARSAIGSVLPMVWRRIVRKSLAYRGKGIAPWYVLG